MKDKSLGSPSCTLLPPAPLSQQSMAKQDSALAPCPAQVVGEVALAVDQGFDEGG